MPRGDGQQGKRRGRYGTKTAASADDGRRIIEAKDPAKACRDHVEAARGAYMAAVRKRVLGEDDGAAKERDLTGAESSARQLAQVEALLSILLEQRAQGTLPVDEAKSIAALSREARNLRAELGLQLFNAKGELTEDEDEL